MSEKRERELLTCFMVELQLDKASCILSCFNKHYVVAKLGLISTFVRYKSYFLCLSFV